MKKIIINILWLLLENSSRIWLALFTNAFLARGLGVENFGIIQYSLSLIVIFSSISFICGAEVIVPMLTNAKGRKIEYILGNVFILRIFFSTIAYLLTLIYVYVFDNNLEIFYLIAILGLTMLVGESFAVITAWLQANTNIKLRSLLVILSSLLKFIIIATLYFCNITEIKYYALAWVIEAYIIAIGLYFIYKKHTNYMLIKYSKRKVIFFLKKGFPFFLSLLLMYAFIRMDIIMLKQYSNLKSVGLYSAAYQLIGAISLIAPILAMSIAPSIIYKSEAQNIKLKILYISLGMGLIGTALSLSMMFFSKFIILTIYGVRFEEAILIFKYLLVAMILYFINEGMNIYFLKIGNGKLLIIKWGIVLLSSIIVYMYFIPKYSAIGGVIGYATGYTISILFSLLILYKDKSINMTKGKI
ncbi:hypothetical protein E4T80_04760 [Muribacter muris]|uniref:Polysaccharide biosynthesis protein C-terminal domain-containing protein n=1 Tax=Muribacter muris TaxID=67855 RepID=A0A4Y9JZT0_9PAST|nr:oligosaccharide flippase family protein [Muribacter muris]MBF0784792.1 oligosaccharide flippase family protein [Muribacter muris]MBF0826649.1 oligosaccharide flippase family protein [Muribacter muris]TFV11028.1 hypothetical protein E4T80_04760 [Muribacter muris]